MKKLALLLFILLLLGLALIAKVRYSSATTDFEGSRSVIFPSGSSFEAVQDSLDSAGIAKKSSLFSLFGTATGWRRQMKPGHYSFESGASIYDLYDRIRKGLQTPIKVTIPPGTRPGVVAAVLRRDLAIDSTKFREALRNEDLLESLGTDDLHAFGHLLPETYNIYWGSDEEAVVKRLHREAKSFYDRESKDAKMDVDLNRDEVIRMASIVEWEARLDEEKPRIAGVYLNRLKRRMRLQADPTVQYALMQADGGRMRRLLFKDYKFESVFNTYTNDGLPPGPINNPSPTSIKAVLNPEKHDYIYFVANGDGSHRFSKTLAQHNRAAREYRALMKVRRREQAGG